MIQLFRNCFPLLLETKNLDVRKEYECEKTFLNAIYEQGQGQGHSLCTTWQQQNTKCCYENKTEGMIGYNHFTTKYLRLKKFMKCC